MAGRVPAESRLDIERRFLAALFLWPRETPIEPRDFAAPEHGVIYEAIAEARALFPAETTLPTYTHYYDDCSLAIVIGLIRERAIAGVFGKDESIVDAFTAWADRYITHSLMAQGVTPHAISDLVELVKQCPRCGR